MSSLNTGSDNNLEAFLGSVRKAPTSLSIRLTENRSSTNHLLVVYHLDLSTASNTGTTCSYQLHTDGVKDPNSTWPLLKYTIDPAQKEFITQTLLPALDSAQLSNLASLEIQGLGDVAGSYQELFRILKQQNATALKNLKIYNCIGLIRNVDVISDVIPLVSQVTSFKSTCPGVEEEAAAESFTKLVGSMPLLVDLDMETVPFKSDGFCGYMQEALARLDCLQTLTWLGQVEPGMSEIRNNLCATIASRPFIHSLALKLENLDPRLLNLALKQNLKELNVDFLKNGARLGQYIQTNGSLTKLHVGFKYTEGGIYDAALIWQGIANSSSVRTVSVKQHLMNDAAHAALQNLVTTSTTVESLSIDTYRMREGQVRDLCMGMSQNSTMKKLTIDCETTIHDYSCAAGVAQMITSNNTLEHLTFGQCYVHQGGDVAIGQAIMQNSTLVTVDGLISSRPLSNENAFLPALERNMTLEHFTPATSKMNFYLQLNRIGRKHWIQPNFDTRLWPYMLAKGDINAVTCMVAARPDFFMRK